MAFEVDYLPVGEGENSGDAIVLRFGNLNGARNEQTVVVIDGGFLESGERLVKHIKNYYGTDHVNVIISTHPDRDHSSGLRAVLEQCKVDILLMHRPWEHAEDIKDFFKNKRLTTSGLEDHIEKELACISELEDLATEKGVQVVDPFQGINGFNGQMHILGPSKDYYQNLLAAFRTTPGAIRALDFLTPFKRVAQEAIKWIEDRLDIDLLDNDEDETSAENNSSVITLFNIDGYKLLFTGDAGKTALIQAIEYADSQGISLIDLGFLHVPHHGSKRNLSSKILQKIKSPVAFVSAARESKKHPAKRITNALKKYGTNVYVTRDNGLLHHQDGVDRGWYDAPVEPFHVQVEE